MADKSATIPINNGLVETVRLVELSKDCVMEIAEAVADVMDARTKEDVVRTNADRIRAMSDEELAEFIGGIFTIERDPWGDYDPRTVVMQEPRVEVRGIEDMLDWLRKEATTK